MAASPGNLPNCSIEAILFDLTQIPKICSKPLKMLNNQLSKNNCITWRSRLRCKLFIIFKICCVCNSIIWFKYIYKWHIPQQRQRNRVGVDGRHSAQELLKTFGSQRLLLGGPVQKLVSDVWKRVGYIYGMHLFHAQNLKLCIFMGHMKKRWEYDDKPWDFRWSCLIVTAKSPS